MSPEWLIAEGPSPGRPSLLGQTIMVKNEEAVNDIGVHEAVVVHEDSSGVILKIGEESGASYSYPFFYKVVADA